MKKAINFSDLTQCPFCGCDGFYVRQHAEGTVIYHHSFDGSEFDNNDIGYILIGKNNNNGAIVTNAKSSFTSSAISKISKGTNLKIDLGIGYFAKSNTQINHEYTLYLFFIETNKEQNSINCNFNAYLGLSV